jgi:4-diphosphocytidyl-2-C-methyl-D-erythritol kinase
VKPAAGAADARIQVLAPAKLNLGLRIRGRRADGYHELESVFAPLDLADEIELEIGAADRAGVELALAGAPAGAGTPAGVPADATNLAVRAAAGFLAAAGLVRQVSIRLAKRIPAAAGLGGGSSDAGAVLRALAASFPGALGPEELVRLALALGADVPFFLAPCLARVTGIGERIEKLSDFAPLACLLVNPGVPLATAAVFAAWDARPERPAAAIDPELGLDLANDLAGPAERLCPAIAPLRERLRALGARAVGLSGSGPTVFGIFSDAAAAGRALASGAFSPPVWARVAQLAKAG